MQLSDDRARTKVYLDREPIPDCTSWIAFHGELHPDTDPALIAAQHCDEVAAAVNSLRSAGSPVTVAAISESTYLPAWNVKRAMDSLGITPDTAPGDAAAGVDPSVPVYTDAQLLVLLRKTIGPATITTAAIATATKLPIKTVRDFMAARPNAFQIHRTFRKPLQWSLIETSFGSGTTKRSGHAGGCTNRARETKTIEKLRAAAARRKQEAVAA